MAPEEFDFEIETDKYFSQILIEITGKTLEEAMKIIEDFGISVVEVKYLPRNWIWVKLDAKDIRSLVLKLIESGFSNVKGINTLPSRT
jgi:hypothetical protein